MVPKSFDTYMLNEVLDGARISTPKQTGTSSQSLWIRSITDKSKSAGDAFSAALAVSTAHCVFVGQNKTMMTGAWMNGVGTRCLST